MIDLHAHILPGIDDGASSLEEATAMLRAVAADGCEAIFATPHQRHPLWRNENRSGLAALRKRLQNAVGERPRILAGAEVRVDDTFLHPNASRVHFNRLFNNGWHRFRASKNIHQVNCNLFRYLKERRKRGLSQELSAVWIYRNDTVAVILHIRRHLMARSRRVAGQAYHGDRFGFAQEFGKVEGSRHRKKRIRVSIRRPRIQLLLVIDYFLLPIGHCNSQ